MLDLEKWELAEEFLEICVTSPIHSTPLPVQVEALKKLTLVQLIAYGKVSKGSICTHHREADESDRCLDTIATEIYASKSRSGVQEFTILWNHEIVSSSPDS